jgi:NADPH:quinone reductase-like Zn-dependent oxidoreductase
MTGSRSATKEDVNDVMEMVVQGKLKPVIATILPLSKAQEAQDLLEKQQVVGRVVLVPSSNNTAKL